MTGDKNQIITEITEAARWGRRAIVHELWGQLDPEGKLDAVDALGKIFHPSVSQSLAELRDSERVSHEGQNKCLLETIISKRDTMETWFMAHD